MWRERANYEKELGIERQGERERERKEERGEGGGERGERETG